MSGDSNKDINLRIRAKDQSKKTFKEVNKALDELREAQKKQQDQAKKGTVATSALEKSYSELEKTAKSAVRQIADISAYEAQQKAITETAAALEASQHRLREFSEELRKQAEPTAAQAAALAALTETVNKNNEAVVKAKKSLSDFQNSLGDDVTAAQEKKLASLTKATATAESALDKASKAVERYQKSIEKENKATTDQRQMLRSLEKAVTANQNAYEKSIVKSDKMRDGLARIGISSENTGKAVEVLRKSIELTNATLEEQEKAIDHNAAAQSRHAEIMAAQAAQAQAAANEAKAAQALEDQRIAQKAAAEKAAAAQAEKDAKAAAALEAQRNAQREAAEAKAAEVAAKEAKVAQALELQRSALKAAANDALTAADGWRTAAVGAGALSAAVVPLADQVKGLSKPSAGANASLRNLEKTLEGVGVSIKKINSPIKDLSDRTAELKSVQDRLGDMAKLVDSFRKQTDAVKSAREQYVIARNELKTLSASLGSTSSANEATVASFSAAESKVAAAAQAYRTLADSARNTQAKLNEAGVATSKLAAEESRLTTVASSLGATYSDLSDKVKTYGTAQKDAGDGSRQALSLMQRIRGVALSLTATYTGLYGAIHLANEVITAAKDKQQALSALTIVVGKDVNAQAQEWSWLTKEVNKFGFSLPDAAKQYAKFAASAKLSGQTNDNIHFMYDSMLKIGRAYHMSSDEMSRMTVAVEQMFGKNQLMTDELKTQLGQVLPGAFESAAAALHKTTAEFTKEMQAGIYGPNAILQVIRGLGISADEAAKQASNGIIAAEGRLATARFNFMEQIAKGGFVEQYGQLVQRVTDLLASDKGAEFADAIGTAFHAVGDAAEFVVEHIDGITEALKVIGFVYAGKLAMSFAATLKNGINIMFTYSGWLVKASSALEAVSVAMGTTSLAARACGTSLLFMSKAIPFVGWAIAIGLFLKQLYESSETFRTYIDNLVTTAISYFKYLTNIIKGEYQEFAKVNAQVRKEWEATKKALGGEVAQPKIEAPKTDGGDNVKDPGETFDPKTAEKKMFDKWLEAEQKKTNEAQLSADKAATKKNLEGRLKLVDTEYAPRLKEAHERAAEDGGKAEAAVQKIIDNRKKIERENFNTESIRSAGKAGKSRAEKILEIEAQLKAARDRLATRDDKLNPSQPFAEREAAQVASAKNAYNELEASVRKLGGAEAEKFNASIAGLKEEEAQLTAQKAQLEELQRLQGQLNDLIAARDAKVEAIKAKHDAGLTDEVTYTNQVNEAYNNMKPAIDGAIVEVQKFSQAHKDAFSSPEAYDKLSANLDTYKTKLDQTGQETNVYMKQALTGVSQSIGPGFDSVVSSLTQIKQGTADWGDLMSNLGSTMASFFADLLKQIAMAIIQAAILKALMAAFGGAAGGGAAGAAGGGGAAGAVSAGVHHIGGMAGTPGQGSRSLPASIFAGAQKYHTGGMVGFSPDEVPIVAKQGEEVLTRDDPRNRLNGGLTDSKDGGSTRIIAVDDQRAALAEALKTPDGEKALIVTLRKNMPTVKKMLGH